MSSADFSAQSITGAVECRLFERLSVQLGAGAADGALSNDSSRHDLESGWTAMASSSYRLLDADGFVPFLIPGIDFSLVHAATVERDNPEAPRGRFEALELRLGVLVGTRLLDDMLGPYTGARYSGGPVQWSRGTEEQRGMNRRKYEVPVGMLVGPVSPKGLGPIRAVDGFIEGVVLGQRGVTVGVGYGF